MDKQKILDTVFEKLMKQGQYAGENDGQPMYRIGNLKCGIGHLIPDKLYNEKIEHLGISDIIGEYPKIQELFDVQTPLDKEFLIDVQEEIHDSFRYAKNKTFKEHIKDRSKYIAKIYKLKDPTKRKIT